MSDLISREDAIDKLAEAEYHNVEDYRTAVKVIGELPTADRPTKVIAEIKVDTDEILKRIKEEYEITDRPHGKWIEKPNHKFENYSFTAYKCSECGEIVAFGGYNYCYNCGAKMKGGGSE